MNDNIMIGISNEILSYLTANDIKYKQGKEANALPRSIFELRLLALLNSYFKLDIARKRTVHFSKELTKSFSNLNENVQNLTISFKNKFESGDPIQYNLSTLAHNSDASDFLFDQWNIKHLHLSNDEATNVSEMKGNRGDWLLFFVDGEDQVLFLDVRVHPPTSAGFICFEFLKILESNNWMSAINATYCEKKDIIIEPEWVVKEGKDADKDAYEFMKGKANFFMEINRKYYMINPVSIGGKRIAYVDALKNIERKLEQIPKNSDFIDFRIVLKNGCFGMLKYRTDSVDAMLSI